MNVIVRRKGEPQPIRDADGNVSHYVLTAADYEALKAEAETARESAEDAADRATGERVLARLEAGLDERIPADMAKRLIAGESPVRVWREYRGLSQQALADATGVSRGFISVVETGKSDLALGKAAAIADVLGIELDDLAPAADD